MDSVETRAFNVEEYRRMAEVGILSEKDRVELVQGEIIKMSPIGSRHAACVNRLNTILNRQIAQAAIVSVQNPVRLDEYSEPQPDLVLLKPQPDFYSRSLPTTHDLFLIIEVVETSADYDLNVKLPLYARAGVPEVWLINLPENRVEIYSDPHNGGYRTTRHAKRGDTLTLTCMAEASLTVDMILD